MIEKRERRIYNTGADYDNKALLWAKRILLLPLFLVGGLVALVVLSFFWCITQCFPKELDALIGTQSGRGG